MTAQSQEVLYAPGLWSSGPSGTAHSVVDRLLENDPDFTNADISGLMRQAGIGSVDVVASDSEEIGPAHQLQRSIITRWDVMLNGNKIGYITRDPETLWFKDYSTANPKTLEGGRSFKIRDALYHIIWSAGIPFDKAQRMAKAARVEESELSPEEMNALGQKSGLFGDVVALSATEKDSGGDSGWDVIFNGKKIGRIELWGPSYKAYSIFSGKTALYSRIYTALAVVLMAAGVHRIDAERLAWEVPGRFTESEEDEDLPLPNEIVHGSLLRSRDERKPTLIMDNGELAIQFHDLPDTPSIFPSQWSRISQLMKQKGYDSRGGEDAKRAVLDMQRGGVLRHDDWVSVITQVLGLKAPSQQPDDRAGGATPPAGGGTMATRVFRRAVREWGLTDDSALGGYILPSGRFLDLSGGSGRRAFDHRQAIGFLDDAEQNEFRDDRQEGMFFFQRLGAIRWMPEGPGLHLKKKPTPRQLATIERIIAERPGEKIYVDVGSPKWGNIGQEYPEAVTRRIPQDILHFYRTGTLRPVSQVMSFHTHEDVARRWVRRMLENYYDDEEKPSPRYRPLPKKMRRAHAKYLEQNPEKKEVSDFVDTVWAGGMPPYDTSGSVAVMTRRWPEFYDFHHHNKASNPMDWGGNRESVEYDVGHVRDVAADASFSATVELSHDSNYKLFAMVKVIGRIGDKSGWDDWNGLTDKGFILVYDRNWAHKLETPIPVQIPEPAKTKLARKAQAFIAKLRTVAKIDHIIWPKSLQPYTAESLVATLLGEDTQMDLPFSDFDNSTEFDIADISNIADKAGVLGSRYTQIDGDYGDPWLYGGTWYSEKIEQDRSKWDSLIHIDGVESEEFPQDYDTYSKRVQKIYEEGGEEGEWKARYEQLYQAAVQAIQDPDADELERVAENAKDATLQEIADHLNANRKMTVYRTNTEDDPEMNISEMNTLGITPEQWVKADKGSRWALWAQYHGWHELNDQPTKMTKAELSAKLGVEL